MIQTSLAANRRGILCLSGAMACYIANDALVKYASSGLAVGQMVFLRGLMATLLVLVIAHAMGTFGQMREAWQPRVIVRSLLDALGTCCYLWSLMHLPLPNAVAIGLAAPLFLVVFAVILLRERVDASRWLAIAVGFTGVLLIIQPSATGFNLFALVCLLGVLFHALRDLLTRTIQVAVPAIIIMLTGSVMITLFAGAVSIVQGWQPLTALAAGLLALAAVFLSVGGILVIAAMRNGELSVVAPFRYSGLLFALILGYLIWGDVPNVLAWCGIVLLIGAGLYILHRERARSERPAPSSDAAATSRG
ncbi:MAG: DMT family transporter [Burkholderiaceae bacterium]